MKKCKEHRYRMVDIYEDIGEVPNPRTNEYEKVKTHEILLECRYCREHALMDWDINTPHIEVTFKEDHLEIRKR